MKKETLPKTDKKSSADESFNSNLSARPQGLSSHKHPPDFDPSEKNIDYGEMNLRAAKISGYTDRKGHAVSMSKKDTPGLPTGALTDIGAGRSSVVKKNQSKLP